MIERDLTLTVPALHPAEPMILSLQSQTKPVVAEDGSDLQVGQELIVEDTGNRYWWDGSGWKLTTLGQLIQQQTDLLREIRDLLQGE